MRIAPLLASVVVAAASTAPLHAQAAQSQAMPASPVIASLKGLHDITQRYIMATANLADDKLLAFQPTKEVRTTAQLLGHIADAQYMICSAAAGEQNPNTEQLEKTRTTKAQVVQALEGAFAYCAKVYGSMTEARGNTMIQLFGMNMAASGALAFNSAHNFEHYGNLVTYMRINGIVPPSSR